LRGRGLSGLVLVVGGFQELGFLKNLSALLVFGEFTLALERTK